MSSNRRGTKPSRHHPPEACEIEWIGGQVVTPFYITEGTPYRPELILWLELPGLLVVNSRLNRPGEEVAPFSETLLEGMRSPLIGRPRRPGSIRVADERLAAEVRSAVPEIRVVVAPTPEIHQVLELMSEAVSEDDDCEEESYFEHGRIGEELIEDLFRASKALFHVAPWKVADDGMVLRVDIPRYGVEGACLSIIGALGENIGLVLFPSFEGFERFLAVAHAPRPRGGPVDLGSTTLSLTFEAGSDLPPNMLKEVMECGWPVADAKAYPVVQHRDIDGMPRPLSEKDFRIVTACATSLAGFFMKHRHRFGQDDPDPVCESYFDEDDIEVRFTLPYEAWELFEINTSSSPADSAARPRRPEGKSAPKAAPVGRNQLCPCGSGKKYKLCCLRQETAAGAKAGGPGRAHDDDATPAGSHDLDRKVVARMDQYARTRFGQGWMRAAIGAFRDRSVPESLLGPWAFHHHPVEGKTITRWILEDPDVRLPKAEREWLRAQCASWLSLWEVLDVDPGKRLTLRDLLTNETRVVREVSASETLGRREVLLARVVDYQGESVLCGVYPRPLAPRDAAVVVERARGRLRRKSNIPVERLREEPIGRYLIATWEKAVEEACARATRPPKLQNTDGDPLLVTVDHFVFNPADRTEIQRRLASLREVEDPPEVDDPEPVYLFTKPGNELHRSWENTITGSAVISADNLQVESNSIRRADSLRQILEASLGSFIAHRAREHSDPAHAMRPGGRPVGAPTAPPSTEETDLAILEMKRKQYADWVDCPIPALGGKSARAAVKTKSGRQMVDLLLKEGEHLEARSPAGQRFDFGAIRRVLGLKD